MRGEKNDSESCWLRFSGQERRVPSLHACMRTNARTQTDGNCTCVRIYPDVSTHSHITPYEFFRNELRLKKKKKKENVSCVYAYTQTQLTFS